MDYDAEIDKLRKEVEKKLHMISDNLSLALMKDEQSLGYFICIVDELSDHAKWMRSELYTALYLKHLKKTEENGKENE